MNTLRLMMWTNRVGDFPRTSLLILLTYGMKRTHDKQISRNFFHRVFTTFLESEDKICWFVDSWLSIENHITIRSDIPNFRFLLWRTGLCIFQDVSKKALYKKRMLCVGTVFLVSRVLQRIHDSIARLPRRLPFGNDTSTRYKVHFGNPRFSFVTIKFRIGFGQKVVEDGNLVFRW